MNFTGELTVSPDEFLRVEVTMQGSGRAFSNPIWVPEEGEDFGVAPVQPNKKRNEKI